MRIDPLLRALADPTRLRIMRLLAHMELAVGELAQVLGQSQPRVSRISFHDTFSLWTKSARLSATAASSSRG